MIGTSGQPACWVCGGHNLLLLRRGNLPSPLTPDAFQITDADYGRTGDLYQCACCGFLECPTLPNVLPFYVEMDDVDYEATRAERALQAQHLLKYAVKAKPKGRLLDVGAGSGILVHTAQKLGYRAEGIEPSLALHRRAVQLDLPVHQGVLPHELATGPYDVVTLIDVIEHVSRPVEILRQIREVMADDGICLIVTPDIGSLAARLTGRHWWHHRIAHIGYFSRATLQRALSEAGLEMAEVHRPSWYFPASYLMVRALSYLPRILRPPVPKCLDRLIVPLNLRDSLLVVSTKSARTDA